VERDGKELFYISSDGKIMAAPVTTGANFDASTQLQLFQVTPRQPVPIYDLFVYEREPRRAAILDQYGIEAGRERTDVYRTELTAKLNK